MRELNNTEIAAVSGAGIFADMGKAIGSAIGGVIDKGTGLAGLDLGVTTVGGKLGHGIGSLLEFNIIGGLSEIASGIADIFKLGMSAISPAK
ncbi:hypothetical protein CBF17_019175 [Pantoea agglomerans]|jgi:hypothetical protein|uniref:hypothetical protein n=1 Tax=Enterobacter agglomerans TaxID=549 RepID=UPI000B34153F|nr:hypothetical protein [Pantoea agglomerans]PHP92227.1 hypothetical protein CBF17_019175 [Pantoea agglomerans]